LLTINQFPIFHLFLTNILEVCMLRVTII